MISPKKLNFTFISFGEMEKIGLECLSSFLKRAGHSVSNIYIGEFKASVPNISELEQDLVVELIRNLKSDVVGFNVFSIFFDLAHKLTFKIKKDINIPIIWGGPHPTISPEMCIEYADAVCIGEGEESIVQFADKISSGEPMHGIKNLWVKSGQQIIKGEVGLIQDLDSIPFPDYGYQNKWFIKNGEIRSLTKDQEMKRETYNILASRGCPYSCTYCSNNVFHKIFSGKGGVVRRRSIKNVIGELKEAKRRFPILRGIQFYDETFTVDKEWLREFCKEYKAQIGLSFFIGTHPNNISREIVAMLKDAGCHQIDVGIQTGSERVRINIYKRYTTNETLLEMAKIFQEFNMSTAYDFIMDNPFENEDDFRQTFELLLKMRPFKLRLYSLGFLPKTEITKMALNQGLITEDRVTGINPNIHKSHNWGGNTASFKESEAVRTKENIFWSNLFIITKYPFIPEKVLRTLSRSRLLKKYPHILSLAVSLFDVSFRKTSCYINYFRVGLRYLLRGQALYLLSKIRSHIKKT